MKRNRMLKFILFLSMIVVCLILFPLTASASPYTEGQQTQPGDPLYYINPEDESDHWVVSNKVWHKCVVDNTADFENVDDLLRRAMVNREENVIFYVATNNAANRKLDGDALFAKCDNMVNDVYQNSSAPNEGDYLQMLSWAEATAVARLSASDNNKEYSYYYFEFEISNRTTNLEEQKVESFLKRWNKEYIENNKTIQAAVGDEKEYYIVKTIYNFAVTNTVYDYEVFENKDKPNQNIGPGTVRYNYSHSAYGALFGYLKESYNPSAFDVDSIDISHTTDSQGLYRLNIADRGLSVCDGYSQVFYYLCKLNGIDAKIVQGDNEGATLTNPDDPHAWNYVYLRDDDDSTYKWYQVDATFAEQNSALYGAKIFAVDYSYFLRGTESPVFSAKSHQQIFDDYQSIASRSNDDYSFHISTINLQNSYIVITRTKEKDSQLIADYIIVAPDGNYYKINNDTNELEKCNTFVFNGKGYYYSLNIFDLADGVEYQSQPEYLKDHGEYPLFADDMHSSPIKSYNVIIDRLDMSDWKSYDEEHTRRPTSAEFIGDNIEISADIYDVSSTKLIEGKDYVIRIYEQTDKEKKNPISPYYPGKYWICIDYYGNYCNTLSYEFEVMKADLSLLEMDSINVRFGTDMVSACKTLKLGNMPVYKDKDFSVKIIGGLNYLDEGVIRITALSSSSYLKSGTYTDRKYKIASCYNISSLFNNKYISTSSYKYTGKQIKPDNFVLAYNSSGKKITLVKGKDYNIDSYKNNTKSGTGYVIVKFKGNYTGSAQMKFNIICNEFSVSIPDLKYTGKKLTPAPVVKFGGYTLKKGKDYTFSSTAKTPGIYKCHIKGKGSYSKITADKYFFVNPGKISSLKASSTASSVKLSWKGQGGNCYYEIYGYDLKKKSWKRIAVTNKTSYNASKIYTNNKKAAIGANKEYKFRVRAYFSASINGKKYTKYGSYATVTQRTKPKTPSFKKATKGKSTLKMTWAKDSSVSGYDLILATNSKYSKGVQKKTIKKNKTTSHTFKKLKKGKTYYVKMRSYKTVSGKKIYSSYSKTFKVKL